MERIEIAGELCDDRGGLTGKTLACGLAWGVGRILEGVKNLRRSLWLWVGKNKSREDSSESNSWIDFEKHVDKVFAVMGSLLFSVM